MRLLLSRLQQVPCHVGHSVKVGGKRLWMYEVCLYIQTYFSPYPLSDIGNSFTAWILIGGLKNRISNRTVPECIWRGTGPRSLASAHNYDLSDMGVEGRSIRKVVAQPR